MAPRPADMFSAVVDVERGLSLSFLITATSGAAKESIKELEAGEYLDLLWRSLTTFLNMGMGNSSLYYISSFEWKIRLDSTVAVVRTLGLSFSFLTIYIYIFFQNGCYQNSCEQENFWPRG